MVLFFCLFIPDMTVSWIAKPFTLYRLLTAAKFNRASSSTIVSLKLPLIRDFELWEDECKSSAREHALSRCVHHVNTSFSIYLQHWQNHSIDATTRQNAEQQLLQAADVDFVRIFPIDIPLNKVPQINEFRSLSISPHSPKNSQTMQLSLIYGLLPV